MKAIFHNSKPTPLEDVRRGIALFRSTARYLTPKKVNNLVHCEMEKLLRRPFQNSVPYIAIIDVVNRCNLHCPYCPTGARRKSGREKSTIHISLIKKLLSDIGPYLISANLFNWGEPFLHPKIKDIIAMFHSARVATHISSNLNSAGKDLMEDISRAGLDYLTVSLSGISQDIYQQYHRGGKFELMRENLAHLVSYKKRANKNRPIIEWKYLLFKHNRHEVKEARRLSAQLGVDVFRVVRGGGEQGATVEKGEAPGAFKGSGLCHQLWNTVVINADGAVPPCCYLFFREDDFGDYKEQSLASVRNNETFLTARKFFNPSLIDEIDRDLVHPCLKCEIVHNQGHLAPYLKANPHAKLSHRTGGP